MTWQQLADKDAALAAALQANGFQRGGHLALLGDNRPRLYVAMGAAQWLDGGAVPLYQDATVDELTHPLQAADVTHVFAEDQEQVDKLLEILPRCSHLQQIVYDEDRGMCRYAQPQLVSFAEFRKQGDALLATRRDAVRAEAELGRANDAAAMYFTSGTTGRAKGVVLPLSALIDRARTAAKMETLNDRDVTMGDPLIYGPLRDVLGMSRLRVAYTAGEAISADPLMFFRSIGINLKQRYRSTETSVFVCVQPDGEVKPDTVGPAIQGVELQCAAQRELRIRSPGLFSEQGRCQIMVSAGWLDGCLGGGRDQTAARADGIARRSRRAIAELQATPLQPPRMKGSHQRRKRRHLRRALRSASRAS